jgi:hypothetical protein
MVTAAEWRTLALSMPGAEEKSHFEQPDFRVKNKIFAGLSKDRREGTLKLSPEAQAVVLSAKPDTFRAATGAWGRSGWTHVILARAHLAPLVELMEESWRSVAPRSLAASTANVPPLRQRTTKAAAKERPRKR